MQNVQLFRGLFYLILTGLFVNSSAVAGASSARAPLVDLTYHNNIKTVRMHAFGRELSYPVIEFGTSDKLQFSFDDLDADVKTYNYRIIHCNADWTASSAFPSDYMDGFFENRIDNYRFSFNTFVPYTHYSLVLPNDDVKLKMPGNYVLAVYEGNDQENIVLTRRFMVCQTSVNIQGRVHRPHLTYLYNTGQQITFSVLHPNLPVGDPFTELFVTVMQNGRTDNSISAIKPMYVRSGEIVYEHEEVLTFPAGNEFRNFDTKSMRYQTEFIRSIEFSGGINHVELHSSSSRYYARYFSHHDINGKSLIRNEEGRDASYDADYVMVWFSLAWEVPFDNGNVYLMGELSDWNFYNWSSLTYNYDTQAYELGMLIKQGYYNYQFVLLEDNATEADPTLFEGNFFETENDYFIMVYHRPPGSRFDRLIGTRQINSRK